jgi:hypothetical protein
MTDNIITLSEERIERNKSEYRMESVALYGGMKSSSLQRLAQKMISEEIASGDDEFAVYRGTTPVFQNSETGSYYMPLSWYADGRAFGRRKKKDDQEDPRDD